MAPQSPWSVKGIDPEAREAAKIAARRAGLTVGQWLNQTIRTAAAEQLTGRPAEGPLHSPPNPNMPPNPGHVPPNAPPPGGGYAQQPPPQPGYAAPSAGNPYGGYGEPPGGNPPAPTLEAIFESIQKLNKRMEDTEKATQQVMEPLAEKVDELAAKVEESGTSGIATAPLERAVMRLTERVAKMEGPSQDSKEKDRKGRRLFGGKG